MAKIKLYSDRLKEVGEKSGLNWCFADANVNSQDAYIAIPKRFLREYPNFFPAHGECIEVTWDDGTNMTCLLEGTQEVNGQITFKQISSYKDKSVLGSYLRNRLKVNDSHLITRSDLEEYGRDDIEVSKLNDKYIFDFSN
ncbi:hypothetical protein [Amedibacillus sp. YH-ame10]